MVGIRGNLTQMQNKKVYLCPCRYSEGRRLRCYFNADLSDNSEALLDDYFVALLAPAKAKIYGVRVPPSPYSRDDAATPKVLEAASTLL